MRGASLALLLLSGCAGRPSPDWQETLEARVPGFRDRVKSPEEQVRRRLLQETTYFRPRDSAHYPPYFRLLLRDPSAALRWEGVQRLWEHGLPLRREELPDSFEVPLIGLVRKAEPPGGEVLERPDDPSAGWAIHVLGLLEHGESAPAARRLLSSKNLFIRFSAAAALLRMGDEPAGTAVLVEIAQTPVDPGESFYRVRAAEILVRGGRREYRDVLVEMVRRGERRDYADGPAQILDDLPSK